MSLKQIAYKSMIVNISDAIVMNAKPLYALLSVAIPKHIVKRFRRIMKGFKKLLKSLELR